MQNCQNKQLNYTKRYRLILIKLWHPENYPELIYNYARIKSFNEPYSFGSKYGKGAINLSKIQLELSEKGKKYQAKKNKNEEVICYLS